MLARFASEGMVSLESLQDSVREKDLARAIALLGAAHTIYVLGLGGSFPVAAHLTYVLRKLGRRVVLLDGLGSALGDQAAAATPQDALIAISFKTYNPDTVRLFPELVARGVPAVVHHRQSRALRPLRRQRSQVSADIRVRNDGVEVPELPDLAGTHEQEPLADLAQDIELERRRRMQADEDQRPSARSLRKKSSMKPM